MPCPLYEVFTIIRKSETLDTASPHLKWCLFDITTCLIDHYAKDAVVEWIKFSKNFDIDPCFHIKMEHMGHSQKFVVNYKWDPDDNSKRDFYGIEMTYDVLYDEEDDSWDSGSWN